MSHKGFKTDPIRMIFHLWSIDCSALTLKHSILLLHLHSQREKLRFKMMLNGATKVGLWNGIEEVDRWLCWFVNKALVFGNYTDYLLVKLVRK